MTDPVRNSLSVMGPHGFHTMVHWNWGPEEGPPVVCMHGLSRNGRDFDRLAATLGASRRVVCPDMVGRGESDWLPVREDYDFEVYAAMLAQLLARLGAAAVDWVGTSMGGLLGMGIAARAGTPIRRLVLNDIGPHVALAGLERIRGYVGLDPTFASYAEAVEALRRNAGTFGPMDEAQFREWARISLRRREGGGWTTNYDPQIAWTFSEHPLRDIELWETWEAIRCPVLVVRGTDSDLLLPEAVERMARTGPGCEVVEIDGVGHAPTLVSDLEIGAIDRFLSA